MIEKSKVSQSWVVIAPHVLVEIDVNNYLRHLPEIQSLHRIKGTMKRIAMTQTQDLVHWIIIQSTIFKQQKKIAIINLAIKTQ